jgi:HPt (histidine-containing phosphotransfer) domain-containing protein
MERADGRKRCTIVAISSNDDRATMDRAIAGGCDHYLVKPAPRETIWQILAGRNVPAEPEVTSRGGTDTWAPVFVDPDLRDSLPAFLESRRQALDEIPIALARDDRAALRRLAHKLAGGFSLYGFAWAAAQCRAMEREAPDAEAGALTGRAAAVRDYLERVEIRFGTGDVASSPQHA